MTQEQTGATQAPETTEQKPELTEAERLAQERAAENEANMRKWMKNGPETTPAEVAGEMQAEAAEKTAEVVGGSEKLASDAHEAGAEEIAQKFEGLGGEANSAKEGLDSDVKTEAVQEASPEEKKESAKALESIRYNDTYNIESLSGQELNFTEMQIRVLRGEEPAIKDLSVIARDLGIQSADKWTHFQREFPNLSAEDKESLATELTDKVAKARETMIKAEESKDGHEATPNDKQEKTELTQAEIDGLVKSRDSLDQQWRDLRDAIQKEKDTTSPGSTSELHKLYEKQGKLSDQMETKFENILGSLLDGVEYPKEDPWKKVQFKGKEIMDQAIANLESINPNASTEDTLRALAKVEVPLLLRFGTLGKLKRLFDNDAVTQEYLKLGDQIQTGEAEKALKIRELSTQQDEVLRQRDEINNKLEVNRF